MRQWGIDHELLFQRARRARTVVGRERIQLEPHAKSLRAKALCDASDILRAVDYVSVIFFGIVIILGLMVAARMNELFCISVRKGRVMVLRGRVPPSLVHDIVDIVKRQKVQHGTVRGIRSDGHARLVTRGIDDGTTQRMRNVFGQHPLQKYRSLPAAKTTRNIGQVLGVAWLAWVLAKASDYEA